MKPPKTPLAKTPLAKTPLALTMGDPAGIGPDVALSAYARRRLEDIPPFVLIGDVSVLRARAEMLAKNGGLRVSVTAVESPGEAVAIFSETLPVLPLPIPEPIEAGTPQASAMGAVRQSIDKAVELVRTGHARAIVTNPISKSQLYQQGFEFPGHTEYLAALVGGTHPPHPVMMLASDALKVVPVTIHIPLKDVARTLTADLLKKTIEITARGLQLYFGYEKPRLAVSGLNPHAGEEGRLGQEETETIARTIEAAQQAGIDVRGPFPADTLFHEAARERYDTAICMYHDQALVPFKTLAFEEGVNVTLGLPFVRTSPDHGTAFDIAGTGKANPRSLIEALRLADKMTARWAARESA